MGYLYLSFKCSNRYSKMRYTKHKWACAYSRISSGTFLYKTVIINWSCQLMAENMMMTFQCIIKNYCHCCYGMIPCGLTSVHEHRMRKFNKSCLVCVQYEGGKREKIERGGKYDSCHTAARTTEKLLFWSHCVGAGLALITSVHDVTPRKWEHVMWLCAASSNVHSLIKFSTKNAFTYSATPSVPLPRRHVTGMWRLRLYRATSYWLEVAKWQWDRLFSVSFSFPCPYISISSPNSYFVHLSPMLYDLTNWHHVCHRSRTLYAEWHNKHDRHL